MFDRLKRLEGLKNLARVGVAAIALHTSVPAPEAQAAITGSAQVESGKIIRWEVPDFLSRQLSVDESEKIAFYCANFIGLYGLNAESRNPEIIEIMSTGKLSQYLGTICLFYGLNSQAVHSQADFNKDSSTWGNILEIMKNPLNKETAIINIEREVDEPHRSNIIKLLNILIEAISNGKQNTP